MSGQKKIGWYLIFRALLRALPKKPWKSLSWARRWVKLQFLAARIGVRAGVPGEVLYHSHQARIFPNIIIVRLALGYQAATVAEAQLLRLIDPEALTRPERGMLLCRLAEVLYELGEYAAAGKHIENVMASAMLTLQGDLATMQTFLRGAELRLLAGHTAEADALLERVRGRPATNETREMQNCALMLRAYSRYLRSVDGAFALLQQANEENGSIFSGLSLIWAALMLVDGHNAASAQELALRSLRAVESPEALLAGRIALCLALVSRAQETDRKWLAGAQEHGAAIEQALAQRGYGPLRPYALLALARLRLLLDERLPAKHSIMELSALAEQGGASLFSAQAGQLLARWLVLSGQSDSAAEVSRQARIDATDLGLSRWAGPIAELERETR